MMREQCYSKCHDLVYQATDTETEGTMPPMRVQPGAASRSPVTPQATSRQVPDTPHVCKVRDVDVGHHWFYNKIGSDIRDPRHGTDRVTTTPPHGRAALRELRKHCGLMGPDPRDRKLPDACAGRYCVNGGQEEARALVGVHAVTLKDVSQLPRHLPLGRGPGSSLHA